MGSIGTDGHDWGLEWLVGGLVGVAGRGRGLIPSAGPFVAMVIAAVVAWFQGPPDYLPISNLLFSVLVVSTFALIQTMENVWLRPRVMGQNLQIHPAIVFVAVMGSLAISGILTALIIVPAISTFGTIGRYLWHKIFGLNPWPSISISTPISSSVVVTEAEATPGGSPTAVLPPTSQTTPAANNP